MRLQHTLLLLLTRDQEEQHSPATVLLCCANYRLEEDLIEFTCATRGSGGGEGTRGRLFSWKLLLSLSEHYSRVQAMQATVTQCAIRAIVFGGGGGRRRREREWEIDCC